MAGFDASVPGVEAAEPDDVAAAVLSGAVLPAAVFPAADEALPSVPVETADGDAAGDIAGGVSELEPQPLLLNSNQSPARAKTRERMWNLW